MTQFKSPLFAVFVVSFMQISEFEQLLWEKGQLRQGRRATKMLNFKIPYEVKGNIFH